MTSFANLLPDIGGNRPPLTDEELRRLAVMLQDKGEGLASINPKEAQMLKRAGGSGRPLPGTEGLGVQGGPIRSYDESMGTIATTDMSGDTSTSTGTVTGATGGSDSKETHIAKEGTTGPDAGKSELEKHHEEYLKSLEKQKKDRGTSGPKEGDAKINNGITYIYTSGSWVAQQNKGPDLDGAMHYSQAELDAANKNIRLREGKAFIQTDASTFTGDEDFETWFQENKAGVVTLSDGTTITLEDIDKDELKAEFDDQMLLVSKESTAQTADFRSKAVNLFNDGTFTAQGKRTVNADGTVSTVTPTTFEEANAKMTELYPDSYGRLSLAQRQEVLESALKEFARIEAFTLTIADVNQFSRPAPEMKKHISFQDWWTSQKITIGVPAITPSGKPTLKYISANPYKTEAEARTAYESDPGIIADIDATTLASVPGKTAPTIKTGTVSFEEWFESKGGSFTETGVIQGPYKTLQDAQTAYHSEAGNIDIFAPKLGAIKDASLLVNKTISFEDWWASKGGPDGTYKTELDAKEAYNSDTSIDVVDDITDTKIGAVDPITGVTVGAVDDVTKTTIDTVTPAVSATVGAVDDVSITTLAKVLDVTSDAGELAEIVADEEELIQILKDRVAGEKPSVAEVQLKRGTEQNLKALLATTAGVMDPTKLRQTRNMWMDIQQVFTGQKAELRAAEQVQAEENLRKILETKGTREANISIANMQKNMQIAINQGNLDQARKIANQQAALTRVTVQAEMDNAVVLGNLKARLDTAIAQGDVDLRTKIQNQIKEIERVSTQAEIDKAIEVANLNAELEKAIAQGNLDQQAKIQNQLKNLTLVQTQADVDKALAIENLRKEYTLAVEQGKLDLAAEKANQLKDLEIAVSDASNATQVLLANLETERILAVEQGKLDLATKIANLEKEILISKVNTQVAIESRRLEDALAISSFEGEMALEGLETEVELTTMNLALKKELGIYGIDTQEKIAGLDRQQRLLIAEWNKELNKASNTTDQQNALLSFVATVVEKWITS